MVGTSWRSVFNPLVLYLQKIGINVSFDKLNLPQNLNEIQNAVPRSHFKIFAFTILLILSIWLINQLGITITQILDLTVFGAGTYFLTSSMTSSWSLYNISIIAICVAFIAFRLIFLFCTKQKKNLELYVLVIHLYCCLIFFICILISIKKSVSSKKS